MGFRFYRRKRILPGVSLNLSRSGLSVSLGPRGAKITLGPKGIRKTVGIPGTGIFYTEQEKYQNVPSEDSGKIGYGRILLFIVLVVVALVIISGLMK